MNISDVVFLDTIFDKWHENQFLNVLSIVTVKNTHL